MTERRGNGFLSLAAYGTGLIGHMGSDAPGYFAGQDTGPVRFGIFAFWQI